MSIISKIFSAIMSFFMLLFGGVTEIDLDTVQTFELGISYSVSDSYWEDAKNTVYSNYEDWKSSYAYKDWKMIYGNTINETYDEEFFKEKSLAFIVCYQSEGPTDAKVLSAAEYGKTLKVEYENVGRMPFLCQAIEFDGIVIPVSKNIEKISAVEIEK